MLKRKRTSYISLSKRDFLKAAITSGIALASAGFIQIFRDSDVIPAQASTYYFGTDSGQQSVYLPQKYYIGRLGVGELFYTGGAFNIAAATACQTNYYSSHMYWTVKGPSYFYRNYPVSRTCYQYGLDQATKACNAWYEHEYMQYVHGRTIFGDIEPAMTQSDHDDIDLDDGWVNPNLINISDNREVLRGWLDGISNYTGHGANPGFFIPGIYTTRIYWKDWFGSDYVPTRTFVAWLAEGPCTIVTCSPCNSSCTQTTQTQASSNFDRIKDYSFGGNKMVLWQYWTTHNPGDWCPSNCGDYDIALQDGYGTFKPISSIFILRVPKKSTN